MDRPVSLSKYWFWFPLDCLVSISLCWIWFPWIRLARLICSACICFLLSPPPDIFIFNKLDIAFSAFLSSRSGESVCIPGLWRRSGLFGPKPSPIFWLSRSWGLPWVNCGWACPKPRPGLWRPGGLPSRNCGCPKPWAFYARLKLFILLLEVSFLWTWLGKFSLLPGSGSEDTEGSVFCPAPAFLL